MQTVILIVLDGLGVGAMPDAQKYGDQNSNTFGNLVRNIPAMHLPNLGQLGLYHIIEMSGDRPAPVGAFGRMAIAHPGKDTTGGHWEMAGVTLKEPFPTFPRGFPPDLMATLTARTGYSFLGNKVASGTDIIEELGGEHLRTHQPIVYTSADSVFQIAAHEEVIPPATLYDICKKTREVLQGPWGVGRVIARPFHGEPGSFYRTLARKDFSLPPPRATILDRLTIAGLRVCAIGKVNDIFTGRGIGCTQPTDGNRQGIAATIQVQKAETADLIFTNLIDFDMLYGHRNDPVGFARALAELDRHIPRIIQGLQGNSLLIITADHGCDPYFPGSDHTREYVPLMVTGERVKAGTDLGLRSTLADVGATIADFFNIESTGEGESFLPLVWID